MKLPYLVVPDFDWSLFREIKPAFPNWEKSFVSGSQSTLYRVSHFIHRTRKSLVLTKVMFLPHAEGPPGNVHGGATAGLIDEVMGIAVWHHGKPSVTQKLELHYGKMLPLQHEAFVFTDIVARTSFHASKTIEVHATVYGKEKIPHVSAQGIFHQLSAEQLAHFKSKSVE